MSLFKALFGSTGESWASASLSFDAYKLIWETTGINIDSFGWMEQGALTERATSLHMEITGESLKKANYQTYAVLLLYSLVEDSKKKRKFETMEAAKVGLAQIIVASDKGQYGAYGRIPTEFALRFAHLYQ